MERQIFYQILTAPPSEARSFPLNSPLSTPKKGCERPPTRGCQALGQVETQPGGILETLCARSPAWLLGLPRGRVLLHCAVSGPSIAEERKLSTQRPKKHPLWRWLRREAEGGPLLGTLEHAHSLPTPRPDNDNDSYAVLGPAQALIPAAGLGISTVPGASHFCCSPSSLWQLRLYSSRSSQGDASTW